MDGCGEAGISLVVAGGDAPELLEIAEEVLDQGRPRYMAKSQAMGPVRSALGGITAIAPRASSSARSQLVSKALSAMSASMAMPSSKGSAPRLSWR